MLYTFGVRYYDPTLGRWTQQDPLGGSLFDPSTGNRYAYTNDDLTNLTDPTGASLGGSLGSLLGGIIAGAAGAYIPYTLGLLGLITPVGLPALAVVIVTGLLVGIVAETAYNSVTASGLH